MKQKQEEFEIQIKSKVDKFKDLMLMVVALKQYVRLNTKLYKIKRIRLQERVRQIWSLKQESKESNQAGMSKD